MKTFYRLLAFISCLAVGLVSANAATLLPPGEQTFFDQNGQPLAGGTIAFYIPNTLTPKDTYQNTGQTVLNTNPLVLDGSGRAIIYGTGSYREIVKDFFGNIIWDQLTADTSGSGSSYGGVSGGSANAQTVLAGSFSSQAGQSIQFIAGFTNTAALTLIPTGTAGIAVLKDITTGPVALQGGEVVRGNSYIVIYDSTLGAFHLAAYPNPGIGASVSIASTTTTDIGSVGTHNALITGTTTINSFGSSASTTAPFYLASFNGALTITESSAITTPTGANITTANGTQILLSYQGSGNWAVINVVPSSYLAPVVCVIATTSAVTCDNGPSNANNGTYTTPSRTLYLEIEAIGGGSGGGGGGQNTSGGAGGVGGQTTFSTLTANGGTATPNGGTSTYPTAATASGGDENIPGGLGGVSTQIALSWGDSGPAAAGSFYGAGAPPASLSTTTVPPAATSPGSGGGAGSNGQLNNSFFYGWGGNSGAFVRKIISSPAATYTYTVGVGGTGGTAGGGPGGAGSAGARGQIKITAHFQ